MLQATELVAHVEGDNISAGVHKVGALDGDWARWCKVGIGHSEIVERR